MKPTESCRMVRGAGEVYCEYILELRTEGDLVGCDGPCNRYCASVSQELYAKRQSV